jgi:hypothetical protein
MPASPSKTALSGMDKPELISTIIAGFFIPTALPFK